MPYNPEPEVARILRRAYTYTTQVQYAVTARWVFYRLLQDGTFSGKKDYKRFLSYLSKARKGFYAQWRPDTLTDDTRAAVVRGSGFGNGHEWVDAVRQMRCHLDRWEGQPVYVECWFEAAAMASQFTFYANENIPLLAFHGDVSIDAKWKAAVRLVDRWRAVERPVHILYFGDYDPKGLQIPESAHRDVRRFIAHYFLRLEGTDGYANANDLLRQFHFLRVGINEEHIARYNLQENPEHPGTYQWEALDDAAAQELIEEANALLDQEALDRVKEREETVTEDFRAHQETIRVFDELVDGAITEDAGDEGDERPPCADCQHTYGDHPGGAECGAILESGELCPCQFYEEP